MRAGKISRSFWGASTEDQGKAPRSWDPLRADALNCNKIQHLSYLDRALLKESQQRISRCLAFQEGCFE